MVLRAKRRGPGLNHPKTDNTEGSLHVYGFINQPFCSREGLPLYVFPDQHITNQVQDGSTSKFGKPEQVFLQKANVDVDLEHYTHIPVKSYVILLSYNIFTAQKPTNK